MRVALARLMGLVGREHIRLSDDFAAGVASVCPAGASASVRRLCRPFARTPRPCRSALRICYR